jgi:hypothetical protein
MPNYFGPHATKPDYDRAFDQARNYALGEGEEENSATAARIYHVKEDALRKSVYRSQEKKRNLSGLFNKSGGTNKILNAAQEEAVRQYCYEQWEMGLGASHQMVLAAISYLKKVLIRRQIIKEIGTNLSN